MPEARNIGEVFLNALAGGARFGANSILDNLVQKRRRAELDRSFGQAERRIGIGGDQFNRTFDLNRGRENRLQGADDRAQLLFDIDIENETEKSSLALSLLRAQIAASKALGSQRNAKAASGGQTKGLTANQQVNELQQLFSGHVKRSQGRLLGNANSLLARMGAFPQPTEKDILLGNIVKPPKNLLELQPFVGQRPELAQNPAVQSILQKLQQVGSPEHERTFKSTPDSSFNVDPFTAQRIYPDIDFSAPTNADSVPAVDEIPASARAQMIAFLRQKYSFQWDNIGDQDKEILIRDAFHGSGQ